ncbi:MAG: flippase [Parcubacteria group bacterium]
MTVFNQIAKNTVINLAGKIISLVFGLISIAIMARYLGQEGFGYYTTVIAFLSFFGILVDFGLSLTTVQMISKTGADVNKIMNAIMSLRIITAVIFLAIAPAVVWFFPYNIFIKIGVLITVFSFFCVTLIQTLNGLFQQKLKMMPMTVAEVIGRIVLVAVIALAAFTHQSIYWIFSAITISNFVNLMIVLYYSKKHFTWRWQIDFTLWKEIMQRTWPIALSITFNLIYLKMDTIILSLTRSQTEVGLYGATYRVIDILTMLPAVFMGIMLPAMTKLYIENNKTELFSLMRKAFDALMIFAMPIVLGTMIIGRSVMVFIAGSDFAASGNILKVLILASGAIFVASLYCYAVVAVNKQRQMMWAYLTTAILTMIGYIYFIPRYGYWGAGWMTVFSEVFITTWAIVLVYRTTKFAPSFKTFLKTIPAALAMVVVLYFVQELPVLILILIACVVYFGILYLLKAISKEGVMELLKIK